MRVIYGIAGTGKSTYLASLIRNERRSFVVLAATHSAVDNIYHITGIVDRSKFMTLYAYFRIDYMNNIVRGPVTHVSVIYIDEFSLLNKYLFDICIKKSPKSEFIICGDPLQLNAIYGEDESIKFTELRKLEGMTPLAIEHYHLGIFGIDAVKKASKQILKTVYRHEDDVKSVFDAVFTNTNMGYENFHFLSYNEVVDKMMRDKDTTLIASKYAILQSIYTDIKNSSDMFKLTIHQAGIKGFSKLYLYEGMELLTTENTKEYYNGQRVFFADYSPEVGYVYVKTETGELLRIDKYPYGKVYELPLIPSRLLTVHKSQGMTLNSVIVCIDDLFDSSMLYTAITRAKREIAFYTKNAGTYADKVKTLFDAAHISVYKELVTKFYKEECEK